MLLPARPWRMPTPGLQPAQAPFSFSLPSHRLSVTIVAPCRVLEKTTWASDNPANPISLTFGARPLAGAQMVHKQLHPGPFPPLLLPRRRRAVKHPQRARATRNCIISGCAPSPARGLPRQSTHPKGALPCPKGCRHSVTVGFEAERHAIETASEGSLSSRSSASKGSASSVRLLCDRLLAGMWVGAID